MVRDYWVLLARVDGVTARFDHSLAVQERSAEEIVALSRVHAIRKIFLDVVGHAPFVMDQDHICRIHQIVGGVRVLRWFVCLKHAGIFVVVGLTSSNHLGNVPEVLVGDEASVGAPVDKVKVRERLLIIADTKLALIPFRDSQTVGAVPVDPACESTTTCHTDRQHQKLHISKP